MSKNIFIVELKNAVTGEWLPVADLWTSRESAEAAAGNGVNGRVVECGPVEPWVLVSERLPEHMERVEFMPRGAKRHEIGWFYRRDDFEDATFGTYLKHFVFCWRPAREVGELPKGAT